MGLYQQLSIGEEDPQRPVPVYQKTSVRLYAIGAAAFLGFLVLISLRTKPPTYFYSGVDRQDNVHVNSTDGTELILDDKLLNSLDLTEDQCQAAFPRNYETLLRISQYHKSRGGITKADADKAGEDPNARFILADNQLYIAKYRPGFQSRALAVIQSLHAAISMSPEPLPDVDFSMGVDDVGRGVPARWELTSLEKDSEKTWLLADFGFYNWPEARTGAWTSFRAKAQEISQMSWSQKIPKLFWRGVPMTDQRKELLTYQERDWADMGEINWYGKSKYSIVSLPDHCKNRYLAATEGGSYSGRLKYLLNCRSVIISHPRKWWQHFHHLIDHDDNSSDQNIIYLPGPVWEGLDQKMEDIMQDDERAQLIASNMHRTFARQYLTPAAIACYWRRAIREYASVQHFTPTVGDAKPFEDWILSGPKNG